MQIAHCVPTGHSVIKIGSWTSLDDDPACKFVRAICANTLGPYVQKCQDPMCKCIRTKIKILVGFVACTVLNRSIDKWQERWVAEKMCDNSLLLLTQRANTGGSNLFHSSAQLNMLLKIHRSQKIWNSYTDWFSGRLLLLFSTSGSKLGLSD